MGEKSEKLDQISVAICAVMSEATNIAKNSNVGGSGSYGYKGLKDVDVKSLLQPLMEKNGLSIMPIDISNEEEVSRWEENTKQKKEVFISILPKYLLLHTSGQFITLTGYGHGIDSQDKAPGKALTYAMKYVLISTFMIPIGDIDDTDNTHSDDIGNRPANASKKKNGGGYDNSKPWLNMTYKNGDINKDWALVEKSIMAGETSYDDYLETHQMQEPTRIALQAIQIKYNSKNLDNTPPKPNKPTITMEDIERIAKMEVESELPVEDVMEQLAQYSFVGEINLINYVKTNHPNWKSKK